MSADSIPPDIDRATLIPPEYVFSGRANPWGDWRNTVGLALNLTRRRLADRYRGSALGFLWSLFNPLLMMATYTFVFQFVFRQEIPGVPYPAFFLTGYMAWQFFYVSMMNAAASVVDGAYLVNKTYFPRIALPISAILANAFNYLASVPILLIFNAALGLPPGWQFFALFPLALALLVAVALGVGLFVASVAPFFRDVIQLLDVFANAWFFGTPILYPLAYPEKSLHYAALTLYRMNPMAGIAELFRGVFLGRPIPWADVAVSATIAAALVFFGWRAFAAASEKFSDAD